MKDAYDARAGDAAGDAAPGILAPVATFGTALALGIALGRYGGADAAVRRRLGVSAVVAGAAVAALAAVAVKRSSGLVTTGSFAYSRNPAYVGATSIYIGAALYAGSLPALTLLPVALALIDSGVVEREERALERRFGEAFRSYRAAVPRWFSLF